MEDTKRRGGEGGGGGDLKVGGGGSFVGRGSCGCITGGRRVAEAGGIILVRSINTIIRLLLWHDNEVYFFHSKVYRFIVSFRILLLIGVWAHLSPRWFFSTTHVMQSCNSQAKSP